jgi:hypothetical protein
MVCRFYWTCTYRHHQRACLFWKQPSPWIPDRLSTGRSGLALSWFCRPWPWPLRSSPPLTGTGPDAWLTLADPGPQLFLEIQFYKYKTT